MEFMVFCDGGIYYFMDVASSTKYLPITASSDIHGITNEYIALLQKRRSPWRVSPYLSVLFVFFFHSLWKLKTEKKLWSQ